MAREQGLAARATVGAALVSRIEQVLEGRVRHVKENAERERYEWDLAQRD
jgi:hypothetical protein